MLNPHTAGRATVQFLDDQFLGHVDETTGQVAGVRGTQSGVTETLTGTVRRDEVLEDREAFAEGRLNRTRNHLTARVGHEALHGGNLTNLLAVTTGTRVHHHADRVGVGGVHGLVGGVTDFLVGLRPDLNFLLTALVVDDHTTAVVELNASGVGLVLLQDGCLIRRRHNVVDGDGQTGLGGVLKAQVLDGVEGLGYQLTTVAFGDGRNNLTNRLGVLTNQGVHVAEGLKRTVFLDPGGQRFVEEDATRGRDQTAARALLLVASGLEACVEGRTGLRTNLDWRVQCDGLVGQRVLDFEDAAEDRRVLRLGQGGVGDVLVQVGQVVRTKDHVLGRFRNRTTSSRGEDVVRREHQNTSFGLGLGGQRHVHGHLVTVEVSVERLTDERVNLDGLAVDQNRFEGLDTETVQRRGAVQQDGVLADDLFEDVPHHGLATLDHALGALDVLGDLGLDQALHNEGLEEFQGHHLGQTTLVQLQRRAHHDDRTARVVHALTEQVLTEATLLTLEHVGERLERTTTLARDGTATTAVVEQGVNRFLEHALLVVHDDVRRTEVKQALESVVAVNHSTVEVVQVGGRETTTVELNHRTKVRRDDRNGLENHGARVVHAVTVLVATVEGLHDGQTLEELGVTLRRERLAAVLGVNHLAHDLLFFVEVHVVDQLQNCVGTHATLEVLAVAEVHLAVEHFVFDDLTAVEAFEGVERLLGQLALFGVAAADSVEFLLTVALQRAKF